MNNKIDLIQFASTNKNFDLDVWSRAEKTVSELKKLGVKMESEYRISSPFESKAQFSIGVPEEE